MLGQQACGKTSLVERYMKGTFRGGDYHSVSLFTQKLHECAIATRKLNEIISLLITEQAVRAWYDTIYGANNADCINRAEGKWFWACRD